MAFWLNGRYRSEREAGDAQSREHKERLMLDIAKRVLRQLSPHEHSWRPQNLGGGLERSVCERCGGVRIINLSRPSLRKEAEARRLWHLG